MKITLLMMGKTDASCWKDALEEYRKRLVHYLPFEIEVIPDVKHLKKASETQQKEREGALLLNSLQAGDVCVLLDENGTEYTSVQFAAYLERKMHTVAKRLVFVTGGPYGFSEAVYRAAPERISLSKMTLSHQMIRPVFAEQLYRAMTILRNEPYHHQ
ncbi:MAG: 23S rRNA (pseudouridine(1915)-N(3))-methyltransferase RlmH [Tannerella sp.]|jgi:23S rRNA (pseudouridine1915-N3)-methyltransferase|nr:23S rRNA (pseudouridine(1915)-N(3))-methyltransferase RlmH [Tannerella sp.]